jgi:uncharacterized membrane protein affecting hemolysin expression
MIGWRERDRGALTIFATLLGAAAIVLVAVNGFLFLQNQTAQAEVNERQQVITQSAQLSSLNESLIRAVATSAANNNDDKLRDVLTQNGISYTINPTANPTANPPAPAGAPANGTRR